jgi:hypothetical protein
MANRSKINKAGGSGAFTKITATSLGVQGAPSWFSRDSLWGLILILSVILTYTPVWKAGFVYDDSLLLTTNPCVVGPLGLKEIWHGTAGSGWDRVGPVFKFYHSEETVVATEPLCRPAADPRDGELASDFGL